MANSQKELLANFISTWHPASQDLRTRDKQRWPMTVTAGNADAARQYAAKGFKGGNPKQEFLTALSEKDANKAHSVLEVAWTIGVPESNDCWMLPGARFIVDMLDDWPENEKEQSK